MRWQNLFTDLESQLERELDAEAIDVEGEEERLRLGELTIRDRLAALVAAGPSLGPVHLTLAGGDRISVVAHTVGADWMVGVERSRHAVVPFAALSGITLTTQQVAASVARVGTRAGGRVGFGVVLRDLCRRRRPVDVTMREAALHGTIDRVGADHFDLALHEPGVARRDRAVTEYRVVARAEVVLVRV